MTRGSMQCGVEPVVRKRTFSEALNVQQPEHTPMRSNEGHCI